MMSLKSKQIYIVLLLSVLATNTCRENSNAIFNQECLNAAYSDSIRILALGDGYTEGVWVSEDERWPNQLADSLDYYGIPAREIKIIAKKGWTSENLLSALKEEKIERTYDLVGIQIGVMDQYAGRSIKEYENNLRELFYHALSLTDNDITRIFFLSIPDYSITPIGKNLGSSSTPQEIDAFNDVSKAIADQRSVKYFNITPLSRKAENRLDLISPDGLFK